MKIKTEQEVKDKRKRLETQYTYMEEFLSSCYKGSDAVPKVKKELIALRREIDILWWVLDDNLPF